MVRYFNISYQVLVFVVFLLSTSVHRIAASDTLKVGIYENEPKIYLNEAGQPAGIFVDLLNEIAEKEEWQLKYIPTSWKNCLTALKRGEIDIMPDVAFSLQRTEIYDFNKTPVLESWSQVYVASKNSILNLSDLKNKRIATLEGSIHESEINKLMQGFAYPYIYIPAKTIELAFMMVKSDSADAVICNHFFGDAHYQHYGLIKTPVVFNPVSLHFAVTKNKNKSILITIDKNIENWLNTPNSFYYKTLNKYLEKPIQQPKNKYLLWVLIAVTLLLGFSLTVIFILKKIIENKTVKIKQTNRKLTEEKNKLRSYFENAPFGIFVMSKTGVLYETNNKTNTIIGYTFDEINSKSILKIIAPESREDCNHCLKQLEDKTIASGMFYIFTKDSEKKFCRIDSVKIAENQILGFIHDITQLKETEDALRKSEERYRSIINNSLDAILLTSPDGQIYSANKAACELFGMSEEEICKTGRNGLLDLNDPNLQDMIEERKRTGKTKGELTFFRKDQSRFFAEVSTSVYINSEGQERTSMFIRDITSRKEAEKELQKLKENLESQVKEKTHELKERIKELEHFRDVTIEREIRMEELRNEIDLLKQNINKQ
ncbi:MAG: PAS domain S-box protein [Thiohalospira sp.]